MTTAGAIPAFWRWWGENRAGIERAIASGTLRSWVERIAPLVSAVDPRLDWEFGRGRRAQHYFCVSAKGDPEVRVIAERWKLARLRRTRCSSSTRLGRGAERAPT